MPMTARPLALLSLVAFASIASAQTRESETERLNAWFEQKFEEELDFSPMEKTALGRKDDYDRLDDMSEAAIAAQLEWKRASVRDLRDQFDYEVLTPEAQTSWDLWVYQLEQAEAAVPFLRRGYLFNQMRGVHTSLPQFLINFHRVDDDSDMLAYIARIGEAGRVLRQTLERAELAAGEGVHAPYFAYEAVITQSRAVLTGQPFDQGVDAAPSPLWADIEAKLAGLVEAGEIGERQADQLRATAAEALRGSLAPAYEALISWAESELPKTDAVATGVWKLPDGEAFYKERLAASTTTDMTADEVHALGIAEVARIQDEMRKIMREVGFDGSLEEFFESVRTDPRFFYPNTDAGREAYLQLARDYLDAMEARLPDYFGLLPKAGLEVRRVESFREEPGGAQHYVQATPDGSRPAVYYAHLIDMSSMPIPELESVTYHEGLPGHHMQISIAQELEGVPTFRTQIGFTAYIEGWALYSESLAREMGFYEDPYSDFFALGAEIWRAIRLVVDTGLHAKGWTQDEAVQYFIDNSPVSEGQIRSEIERYIVTPGQATSYKIGMIRIQELRRRAESELGDDFDIRSFHDTVLGGGALPLSILERRVDAWIDDVLADSG
jgi:uncharacterized protein (DUF885 family)